MGVGGADRVTLNLLKSYDQSKYYCELLLNKKTGVFLSSIPEHVKVHEANSLNVLTMFRALRKLVKTGGFDYVFSTSGGTNVAVILATLSAGKSKTKSVVSERVNLIRPDKNGVKQKLLRAFKAMSYNKADIVTAVSQELTEDIRNNFGVGKDRLHVVNNPIINDDLIRQKDIPIEHKAFDASKPSILTAVRLIPTKNVKLLISAFNNIKNDTDANLYILGSGPQESELKEMVRTFGLEGRTFFIGFDKNPFSWMRNADVFVLPSNNEGMPGVLIQAMACGAACISTDSKTGPKELINDGVNGFLVEINNKEELSRRLLDLLTDDQLREEFGRKAQVGLDRFEEASAIDSYFKFLR